MKAKPLRPIPKRLLDTLEKMSDYYGSKYLIELVSHPNQPIHATRLRDLFNCPETTYSIEGIDYAEEPCMRQPIDLPWSVSHNFELPVEKADRRYIDEVKRRLLKVLDCLAEAKECNDLGRLEDLYDERDKLTAWLKTAVNIHGRPKYWGDRSAKDYQAVKKNIEKIVAKLEALDPALARYVLQHLRTGQIFVWKVDK